MGVSIAIEDLTTWAKFLPFPRILIIRFYSPGVEPIEPNPFEFAVVAVVYRGVATIKGLCGGMSPVYFKAGVKALKARYRVRRIEWRHDGVLHSVG